MRIATKRLTISTAMMIVLSTSVTARAFVDTPVGGHPGELDVNAQLTLERGKYEPNGNQASFQSPPPWQEYKLGVGYTWGNFGPFKFFSTRLDAVYFRTGAERNDPSVWQVQPEGSSTATQLVPECSGGAEYLGNGECEFYASDSGAVTTATVSGALIHTADFALGLYLRSSIPIGVNLRKFANPRVDYVSGGLQAGTHMTNWFDFETTLFFGSGTFSKDKNATAAVSIFGHFKANKWLLPWKAGFKFGPYIEGDMTERFDARFDNAYSPQALPQPGDTELTRQNDRIRSARFALGLLPYFLVTDHLAVELGYIQKMFGYDVPATQAYFVGLRGLINVDR